MKSVPKIAVIVAVVIMFLVLGYLLRIDRIVSNTVYRVAGDHYQPVVTKNPINNPSPLADYYGEYSFTEVSILSGLSSSTIGYMNEQKSDNTYTISAELFEIRGTDRKISVAMPVYEACALPAENEILASGAGFSVLAAQYQIDSAYKVFTADGQKVYRKIFTSSAHPDLVWLADYNDNTATGVEIVVQSIDKISRQSASINQK